MKILNFQLAIFMTSDVFFDFWSQLSIEKNLKNVNERKFLFLINVRSYVNKNSHIRHSSKIKIKDYLNLIV